MEPPSLQRPLYELADFRQIGLMSSLDHTNYDDVHRMLFALDLSMFAMRDYLSTNARAFSDPLTHHFVLFLIEPEVSIAFDQVPQPSTSFPAMNSLPSFVPQYPSSPPALSPPPSAPWPLAVQTPILLQDSSLRARNINEVCDYVHKFVPARYRDWALPPSGSFVDHVRGWQFTYEVLVAMGYDPATPSHKQFYHWLDGPRHSFKKIIESMGWVERSFIRKSRCFLWASLSTAAQDWDPSTIPNPNNQTVTPYRTWLRVVYLWREATTFFTHGGSPDRNSANRDEADAAILRADHIRKFRKEINKNLVDLATRHY
ncbi:hypothetical protein FB446DRAFT_709283 [Lentinula raphanica]|nr:hypothetical protein FB446DRAFT_709283 [Lentinula raphanica]